MSKKLLLLSAVLFWASVYLFSQSAKAADDGDWYLQREIQLQQNREDYARRVYGSARHTYDTPVTENGITKVKTITKNVVVEDVPSKVRLGRVLLERAKAARGGIAGVLGGIAVAEMIEAVGWVMEGGTYVKLKAPERTDCQFLYTYNNADYCDSELGAAANKYYQGMGTANPGCSALNGKITCTALGGTVGNATKKPNPGYDPNAEKIKIPISPADVGGIALGDYKDPVNSQDDITDKKYKAPVASAYEHDPKGIGEDIANEMDDRIQNAPPTPDGKPAPSGDPKYKNPPKDDQNTNDRSWRDDSTNTAEGDTTPKTDPTTGQPTGGQSISLQFPVFCEWAHSMCKWYDEWKITNEWFKKEPELKDEKLVIDDEQVIGYERFDYIQYGQTCPFSPQAYSLPMGIIGSIEFEADASILCTYGLMARPYIIGLGYLGSLIYLLYALRNGNA